ncbi:MAG: transporter substrate-binding domain-containing protein [Paucibacter sp.]|nr:transporter substrate-binding domain-containing protein [Roseateles sp.]
MPVRYRVGAAALALLALGASNARADERTFTACADPPQWTLMVQDSSGHVTLSSGTFSFDVLEAAMARMGRSVRFLNMPWPRCMQLVEVGEVDFALGAYYSDERARRFSYSIAYSKGTPQVFYMRQRPVRIASKADLLRHRGCGLRGGSYDHYGLQSKDLDLGVGTYDRLIMKLRAGRCDYFVEELEVIAGYKLIGNDYLADHDLVHDLVPGVVAPAAYLIAGLNSRGAALMPQLNIELLNLIRSGQAAQLWRRHAGDIPYQTP